MSDPVNPPELIITISRDKVRLDLTQQAEIALSPRTSLLSLEGLFLEEQLTATMDAALLGNPSLMDHFREVSIVIVDRPNICIPSSFACDNSLADLAGRFLRIGPGDAISTDAVSGDQTIAYALPKHTINVFREYYANADSFHLASLLWSALQAHVGPCEKDDSRLFFYTTGHTLMVIGQTAGKLTFSKCFYIREKGDLAYYSIACCRLLRPRKKWHLTIKGESPVLDLQLVPHFTIDHQLELPALHHIIAEHRSCAS